MKAIVLCYHTLSSERLYQKRKRGDSVSILLTISIVAIITRILLTINVILIFIAFIIVEDQVPTRLFPHYGILLCPSPLSPPPPIVSDSL